MWWGLSLEFWQGVFFWATILAAVAGGLSIASAFVSAVVGYQITDFVQRQADEKIADAKARGDEAGAEAAKASERANKAALELEKFRSPRVITEEQRKTIVSAMVKWRTIPNGQPQSVVVFSVDASFESASLADQIAAVLGPDGVGWNINRYPVMYGKSYSVAGIGILTSRSKRGNLIANDLVRVFNSNGIAAFVAPEKRRGCEDMPTLMDTDTDDTNPWCSSISVMVGEHPR
jgi:hypothetical protein